MKWELCHCKSRFPKEEFEFYATQKFLGKGYISRQIDVQGSMKLQRKEARNLRKEQEAQRQQIQAEREAPRFTLADPNQASALVYEPDSNAYEPDPSPNEPDPSPNEPDYDNPADADFVKEAKPKVKNTNSYPTFVSYGKRNDIPSHVLAGLLNSLRIDDSETDPTKFCSTTKIDNEWHRVKTELGKRHSEIRKIEALKFDGKKGPSKEPHNKEKVIELVTCVTEPGGRYLDHFEPKPGTAREIAKGIFKMLQLYDSTSSLLLIGGDNCITNTGKKS